LAAFGTDLAGRDALAVLTLAPGPEQGRALSLSKIEAALRRAGRRRYLRVTAEQIQGALRSPQLPANPAVVPAYAASAAAMLAVLAALAEQEQALRAQVEAGFGQHPDAEIYLSQPGMGAILGARVLAEFGDDPHRYRDGKARRNYAATSPITRASGKKKIVAARFVHNGRLIDALRAQAFAALNASPGARAFYDELRARGVDHNDALRRLANRLVGILHGCLKTRTPYDEATAWGHRTNLPQSSRAA
jgi:transposase